jgi:hypothetical protein
MICPKPHVASSICLRATIFQNPEGTLRTHCTLNLWDITTTFSAVVIFIPVELQTTFDTPHVDIIRASDALLLLKGKDAVIPALN